MQLVRGLKQHTQIVRKAVRPGVKYQEVLAQAVGFPKCVPISLGVKHGGVRPIWNQLDLAATALANMIDETRRVNNHLVGVTVKKTLKTLCDPDQGRIA